MCENKVFGKETQRKILEKNFLIDEEMKNKTRFPKTLFSLIFQNFETNKDAEFLAQKLLLKTC